MKEKCIFERGNRCIALTEKDCLKCHFYKSEAEYTFGHGGCVVKKVETPSREGKRSRSC